MHDHVVQEQGLVVHFDGAREQTAEVMHVPEAEKGRVQMQHDRRDWSRATLIPLVPWHLGPLVKFHPYGLCILPEP